MSHLSTSHVPHIYESRLAYMMSHVPHIYESCPSYLRVMSHKSMSHVPHIYESRLTYIMSPVPHIYESYPSYLRVMYHMSMSHSLAYILSHVPHICESCSTYLRAMQCPCVVPIECEKSGPTYLWVTIHTSMSPATYIRRAMATRFIREVRSHISMSHVTHIYESCHIQSCT